DGGRAAADEPLVEPRSRAIHRVDRDAQAGVADALEVDLLPQPLDVALDRIEALDQLRRGRCQRDPARRREDIGYAALDVRDDLGAGAATVVRLHLDAVPRRRVV